MKSNQHLKTWAVVIILPVFSIAVATAAVAIQDGDLVPVTQQEHAKQEAPIQKNSQFKTSIPNAQASQDAQTSSRRLTTNPVQSANWRTVRTQDGFTPLVQDQEDDFPTFPTETPLGLQQPNQDEAADVPQDDTIPRVPRSNVELETVNSEFAGWNGVSYTNSINRLSDTIRSSWIHLSETGALSGTIRNPFPQDDEQANFTGVFILKDGQLAAQTVTNEQGEFEIESLKPGNYSLVAYGKNTFAAVGFIALEYRPGYRNSIDSLTVLAVERQGFVVSEFVRQYAPTVAFRNYKLYEIGEEADDPVKLYGYAGLTNHDPSSEASGSILAQPIALVDGRVMGRLHQIDNATGRPIEVRNTTIQLVQGAKVIASTNVDNYGVFEFKGIRPGFYGVIAGGSDGFGAVGIELVDGTQDTVEDDLDASNSRRTIARFVSTATTTKPTITAAGSFDMTLVSTESIGWINHFVAQQTYNESINTQLPDDPMADYQPDFQSLEGLYQDNSPFGGLFNGGGGGGFGGGFGGGGSFGNLAFPVGLGAIISSAIDDHDGGSIIIASPSR